MEPEDPLIIDRHGDDVAILRLNRPERLNAVSGPLYRSLLETLAQIRGDRATRAVVITGTGRAFCVGADLKAHDQDEPTPAERKDYVEIGQRVHRALQTLPKPVVAAVNGHAIGAGLELALSCDFILIAHEAKLRLPELALGTFVGGGTTYTLAQRVGLGRARELILLADFFSGDEATAMGLAYRTLPTDRVLPESKALARRLARLAPIPMALAKELLDKAQRLDFDGALSLEAKALLRCMDTRDWREGVDSFAEKREPRFVGE